MSESEDFHGGIGDWPVWTGPVARRSSVADVRPRRPFAFQGAPVRRSSPATSGPLRILHAAFCERVSGSSRYICDLSARQTGDGHTVAVALPRRGGGVSIYDSLPADVDVFPTLPTLSGLHWLGLARAIWAFRPDIVHFHDGRGPAAIRWIPGRPASVITLHLGYKKTMSPADGLVRIAPWQALGTYRGLVAEAPNWRLTPTPVTQAQIQDLRALAGAEPDDFLIGCVGRLHPAKGADVLLDAFQQVHWPKARLVFVGDGAERQALEAKAQDPRVRFVGFRTDVDAWYRSIDALAAPSFMDQFGMVLVEAMGAGLPIAAAANKGALQTLRGQPVGLFDPGDVQGLSHILEDWREVRPGKAAYDLSAFGPEAPVAAIRALYRQAMAARRALAL